MTIYADIIFLINFLMDFIIFFITAKILKRVCIMRIVFGSLAGAAGYCIAMFFDVKAGGFAAMAISAAICFKPKTAGDFIRIMGLTNIVAFTVGGCAAAVFYSSGGKGVFPFKLLVAVSIGAYIAIKFIIRRLEKFTEKKQRLYGVKIYREGEETEIIALTDTGNSLCEPISGKAVIIAEFSQIRGLLPKSVEEIFINGEENNLGRLAEGVKGFKGFRLIPFSSLGRKNGMLVGFNADRIEIFAENEIYRTEAVIGIYNGKLTEDGFYNALLNPTLIGK